MRQEIYADPYALEDWDQVFGRCFVHIANSLVWRFVTMQDPPTVPPTAKWYTEAGLPWFKYYADARKSLPGASTFKGVKSVAQLGKSKKKRPLPENESANPQNVVTLRAGLAPGQVREGMF